MTLQFTTTNQAATLHGVKCLVYGRAGAGKTFMASTAPSPIMLSAEAGVLSLRGYEIPMIQITKVEDLTESLEWVTRSREAQQFQTIYIDSITEIGEVVLANAKRQVKDPRQAYGELIDKMIATIKAFRDVQGKHVVMTAKQELQKDENTGTSINGPSMPGSKVGPALPYLFDEVFRLGVQKDQDGNNYRFLQTFPDFQYEGKDRSGVLDPIEPPNLAHIFNKIMGTNQGANYGPA